MKKEERENELINAAIFKGNQLNNFSGIFFWFATVTTIYSIFFNHTPPPLLIVFGGLFIAFMGYIMSRTLYYFEVTANNLFIRNHLLFWIRKEYFFQEIEKVSLESPRRMPYCLRIILKNGHSSLFPAASLSRSIWILLKQKLEISGVNVIMKM